jgi:hypothetical protein
MADSRICQFCGGKIRFRMIRGVCVPLHVGSEHCVTHENAGRPDTCHLTKCPRCGENAFFVRHNDGAVWFDDLGRPWDKHACFAETSAPVPADTMGTYLLLRIRSVVRFKIHIDGKPIDNEPGFILHVGRDRMASEVWEVYPKLSTAEVLGWRGRYCYISAPLKTLVLLNGMSFPLAAHVLAIP